ncbi:MAG: hypothetical protein ACJ8CR_05750 [Roseiflexaceae bacterium]
MADTSAAQHDTVPSPAARWLWLGLLDAPGIWLVHFLAIWIIAEWGCLAGWAHFTSLGFQSITVLLVIATCIALPLIIATGLVSWRTWRRARQHEQRRAGQPERIYGSWRCRAQHTKFYPELTLDRAGLTRLVRSFSWPGGFPSYLSPGTPGAIHEGGELGYALATADARVRVFVII